MDREAAGSLATAALRAALDAHTAELARVQAAMIPTIAELERRGAWRDDGAASMESWLVATYNHSYARACELVRAARALDALPVLSEALSSGAVSFDAAAAAAQLATPTTDALLAEEAQAVSADALRSAARRQEAVEAQKKRDPERKALTWHFGADGWCRLSGWLPPAEGECVIAALERAEGEETRDPDTGEWPKADVRAANALVALASGALAEDADPDRACVVVHVGLGALVSGEGSGQLPSGGAVPAETVRKLACDGRIETEFFSRCASQPGIHSVRAAQRAIPHFLHRYVKGRDATCRFPGCAKPRHLRIHHMVH